MKLVQRGEVLDVCQSPPARGRGLKQIRFAYPLQKGVAPRAGARIETLYSA